MPRRVEKVMIPEKVVIITGTRKGIGKFLAEHFLEHGNTVVGCSRKDGSISHVNYRHYKLDVADEDAVVRMAREIKKEFGRVDFLLNNAGVASMNHILITPLSSLKKIFSTNVFGSFLFTREMSKLMIANKSGRIVNFSTVAYPLKLDGEAAYAASKSALMSLTQIGAKELAPFGITVNAVGPTPIETDLIKNVPENKIQQLLERQSIVRFGTFDDVLNVVEFFLSNTSDFVTGQVIYLGGVSS